jgi:hypothetical protein
VPSCQLPNYLSLSKQLLSLQYPLLLDITMRKFLIYYGNNRVGIEFANMLLQLEVCWPQKNNDKKVQWAWTVA